MLHYVGNRIACSHFIMSVYQMPRKKNLAEKFSRGGNISEHIRVELCS